MRRTSKATVLVVLLCVVELAIRPGMAESQPTTPWRDPSPHVARSVVVDTDVYLEVLDWGGKGPPLVLLAGLGNTAHIFDDFAPKLTARHHVYGITRRGFGTSSIPATGYSADRLGDDVLAVLSALKINRPLLVGHSLAGEELSSIGSRFPNRVAGLVYMEATYGYAYYDRVKGYLPMDVRELRKELDSLIRSPDPAKITRDLLAKDLPAFESVLRHQTPAPLPPGEGPSAADSSSFGALADWFAKTRGIRIPEEELRSQRVPTHDAHPGPLKTPAFVFEAINDGQRKFTKLDVPILAICAVPISLGATKRTISGSLIATYEANQAAQVDAFERGVHSARVVRIRDADHYVFLSNEAEVIRDIEMFAEQLQR
ncbi:MAG TPA: alpha/beta hydrolase [Steroidobacteraceae bacterium]|jgi:pimeloyl-ACP methyl ester carboxylesterase